jgi:hypothetical protein
MWIEHKNWGAYRTLIHSFGIIKEKHYELLQQGSLYLHLDMHGTVRTGTGSAEHRAGLYG